MVKMSFCLFTYNQIQFVREAIQSAFSQTYEPLEIVIIDDGSTDGTAEFLQAEVAAYRGPHQVKLICKPKNLGLADSVNSMIYEGATGDWYVAAAGDDVSLPDRVERIAKLAVSDPEITVIESAVTRIAADGRFLNVLPPRPITLEGSATKNVHGAAAAYHLPTITKYSRIRADVLMEDVVLTTRALLEGISGKIEEPLVMWRRHEDTLSGGNKGNFLDGIVFSRGIFRKHRILAITQQLSDICHAMSERRIDTIKGMKLIRLFSRQALILERQTAYFCTLTKPQATCAFVLRHPLLGCYYSARLFLDYVRT